jgi:hypothetical protein
MAPNQAASEFISNTESQGMQWTAYPQPGKFGEGGRYVFRMRYIGNLATPECRWLVERETFFTEGGVSDAP